MRPVVQVEALFFMNMSFALAASTARTAAVKLGLMFHKRSFKP